MGRWTVAALLTLLCLSLTACATAEPLALPTGTASDGATAEPEPVARTPNGTVRVAYPDVPATWTALDGRDTAAIDLAALWTLPLFRYDPDGQLEPALATDVTFPEVDEGWAVELSLAEGTWSDGTRVRPADVVATVEALRQVREEEWSKLLTVGPAGEGKVRLTFSEPHGRWAHLLAVAPGILPARVLAQQGMPAYADTIPVAGGSFRLDSFDAGRSAVFVAHPGGPLGPPALERVEILFVPSYETGLGLLDAGEVDAVIGHLALNPVGRAEGLPGVRAAAPLGGTSVALEWRDGGAVGDSADTRRAIVDAIDLAPLVTGLLRGVGEAAPSLVPGVRGPVDVAAGRAPTRDVQIDEDIVLLLPRWHEVLGFTGRAVQRDLTAAGAAVRLVTVESPHHLAPLDPHDGALRVRRDAPRPNLGPEADAVPPGPDDRLAEELAATFERLAEDASSTPLFRIGVAHAWRDIQGFEPSSWPGLAFWSADDWAPVAAP